MLLAGLGSADKRKLPDALRLSGLLEPTIY